MNIFAVYDCPIKSAHALDDVRLRKMIVESTQILCNAVHMNDAIKVKPIGLYKPYNVNESTCIWARESKYNFKWVSQHLTALLQEYFYRFDKNHDTYHVAVKVIPFEDYFPNTEFTPFNRQFNKKRDNFDRLMEEKDVHKAYQLYLSEKWLEEIENGKIPTWTKRGGCEFFEVRK